MYVWIRNLHPWDTMCTNFPANRKTLSFWARICPKMDFGLEFQKSASGFRISNLEILCEPFLKEREQLSIFGPKFAHNWIFGSKFQKSKSIFGFSILEILGAAIFRQKGQFWTLGLKFALKHRAPISKI